MSLCIFNMDKISVEVPLAIYFPIYFTSIKLIATIQFIHFVCLRISRIVIVDLIYETNIFPFLIGDCNGITSACPGNCYAYTSIGSWG